MKEKKIIPPEWPRPVIKSFEEVEKRRAIWCTHYDECLEVAEILSYNEGFDCSSCNKREDIIGITPEVIQKEALCCIRLLQKARIIDEKINRGIKIGCFNRERRGNPFLC